MAPAPYYFLRQGLRHLPLAEIPATSARLPAMSLRILITGATGRG
jgi:hypothetical protein